MNRLHRVWILVCVVGCCLAVTGVSVAQSLSVELVITETDGNTVVNEFGTSDTFTIALAAQPSAPVVVRQDFNYLPTEPSVLTFTPETWDIPQVVTVHAAHDYITQATPTYQMALSYTTEMWDGGVYRYAQQFHNLIVTVHDTPMAVSTAPLMVTTLEDSVSEEIAGSLRQMIHIANARAGQDFIAFQPGLTGTLTLQGSLPSVGETLVIMGSGQDVLTISGNGRQHSAFYNVLVSWPWDNTSTVTLTLAEMTLSQLWSAVLIEEATLTDVTVSDSGHGASLVSGYAAVSTFGDLNLHHVTMTGNSGTFGGAAGSQASVIAVDSVFNNNTALIVPESSITLGGSGGALYSEGYLEARNSVFAHNQAGNGGGAIYVGGESVSNSLVSIDSTFTANSAEQGGAIMIKETIIAFIMNNTFSQNHAESGGAIKGSPYVFNSTFSGNTANMNGAAIDGVATVTHSTFSGHHTDQSDGVAVVENGTLLIGSIIANNNAVTPYDCGNNVFGFTLLSDDPNCFGTMGEATGVDSVLRDNGGVTMTHRLLAGSNAIDNDPIVEDDMTSCDYMAEQLIFINNLPLTDQRGVARPYGVACDIGAFEYDGDIVIEPEYGLIENGGFESDNAWVSKRLGVGDKPMCVADEATLTAPDGLCVYQFWASFRPAFKRALVQVITSDNMGGTGDTLTLSGMVEGQDFGIGATIAINISYTDGSTGKHDMVIPAGTYAFTEISMPITLTGTPIEIEVRVEVQELTGRLRLDAVSLKQAENALIPFPATESRPGATLDLPAAPDGFRN
jgi:predicted outer membrane repeat protein